jgi:predicted nucleotidyltransferase
MAAEESPFEAISDTMRKAVAALRDAEVPHLLGGSVASWARGGPPLAKDLDFMIKEQDVERALHALEEAGMRTERPPEEWLVKGYDGHVQIDLIFCAEGLPITDEVIERGEQINVLAMSVRVMALEDVVTTKLLALQEHELDYTSLIQIARSLREKIDWDAVRAQTGDSPYAKAFFTLVEELGIAPRATGDAERRIRVTPSLPTAQAG